MKVPMATLLLMANCSPAGAHLSDSSIAASSKSPGSYLLTCCFSYQQRPVPRSLITSAYLTSSMRSQPAVILVTKKGKTVCTDPQAKWVQEYLEYLQIQQS